MSTTKCPVCLTEEDIDIISLSCGHGICDPCANKSDAAGITSCPVCRKPHMLNTAMLRERVATYRADYQSWRSGNTKGANGELSTISSPDPRYEGKQDKHSSVAGDLHLSGELPPVPTPSADLKGIGGGVGQPDSLYEKILSLSKDEGERFDLSDCAGRVARCILAYYWLLLRFPLTFGAFHVRYNNLWEGPLMAVVTAIVLPIYPLVAFLVVLGKRTLGLNGGYVPAKGNIFFEPPATPTIALLWDYYKALSPPLAQFLMNRGDSKAIAHSWYDEETDKDFWRAHLERVGARVPLELGRWKKLESGAYGIEWKHTMEQQDIVIKVCDESNGIGDAFLLFGEGEGKVNGPAALEEFMRADKVYHGKEALVLEWIRPAAGQEVHTLDIVTIAQPNGEIELLTALYWGDCRDGKTSHSTRAGYILDAEKEELAATCKWYAPGFASMVPVEGEFAIGHKLPGLKKACKLMYECHKSAMVEQPFLKMIGWDVMLAANGPPVFFEGNYAQMRLPRRVFLSWDVMWRCLRSWA